MSGKNIWIIDGDTNRNFYVAELKDKLPKGIYTPEFDMKGLYLKKMRDSFDLTGIIPTNQQFIHRVVHAQKRNAKNLGVLLNGIKGTGKSITAKVLCEEIGYPVIVMDKSIKLEPRPDFEAFINDIDQPLTIFIDEYEKTYFQSDVLLQYMDGGKEAKNTRFFLLTSNALLINENLIDRPSRIRYLKTFDNLTREEVNTYLKAFLVDPSHPDLNQISSFINGLETITIDIIRAIAEEVNDFGFDAFFFQENYNVTKRRKRYNVTIKFYDKEITLFEGARIGNLDRNKRAFSKDVIGADFHVNGIQVGEITDVFSPTQLEIELDKPGFIFNPGIMAFLNPAILDCFEKEMNSPLLSDFFINLYNNYRRQSEAFKISEFVRSWNASQEELKAKAGDKAPKLLFPTEDQALFALGYIRAIYEQYFFIYLTEVD